jgi:hypothetical protein
MSLRLVITIPLDDITDGPGLADRLADRLPELDAVTDSMRAEIGELRAGQYGWTDDPETHAVRTHWAIKDPDPVPAL